MVFFSEQHQVFALTSIELFKKKPILGIGPNNYRKKCAEVTPDFISKKINFDKPEIENCSTHPHNIFFQLLSETGFIRNYLSMQFLIFFYLFKLIKFLFNKNYDQVNFFFLLPVIYYLNPIFPSGNFFNNWYMCFGILGLPFYLYSVRVKKSD